MRKQSVAIFALVLSLQARPELRPLHGSYAAILGVTARALGIPEARHEGTSDIALGGLKFSGNAQKRTRSALLHHGTLLHDLDLGLVERYLREPEKQPPYRRGRAHARFLANLPLPAAEIRGRLAAAWGAVARDPGEALAGGHERGGSGARRAEGHSPKSAWIWSQIVNARTVATKSRVTSRMRKRLRARRRSSSCSILARRFARSRTRERWSGEGAG